AEEPLVDELGMGGGRVFVPDAIVGVVPGEGFGGGLDAVGQDVGGAHVELVGIVAGPGCAFGGGAPIFLELEGVIADAGHGAFGVVAVAGLQPVPGVGGVVADGEAHAAFADEVAPGADDVLHRTELGGVPVVVAGAEAVEIVVMAGERHEVLRAGFLVEVEEIFGAPGVGLPHGVDVFEADFGGVAVGLDVEVVHRVALDVHPAGVPVALLGDALGGPVRPHAELGVAEPVWDFVLRTEGVPCGLKGAFGEAAFGGCGEASGRVGGLF